MSKNIPLPKELQALLDDVKAGRHQWTQGEKDAYQKIMAMLPPDKAAELAAVIPPPGN